MSHLVADSSLNRSQNRRSGDAATNDVILLLILLQDFDILIYLPAIFKRNACQSVHVVFSCGLGAVEREGAIYCAGMISCS